MVCTDTTGGTRALGTNEARAALLYRMMNLDRARNGFAGSSCEANSSDDGKQWLIVVKVESVPSLYRLRTIYMPRLRRLAAATLYRA
jgi:hypothetical protein